ncbi:MAG: BtrH N-terminal domain-containing protein [Clostridia bacterium]|nr:BtrH N-terminal domain-containing protein [Clostridia bacterium]
MDSNNSIKKSLLMKDPPVTLYPHIANKLSILLNYEETLPWFYSNFIQMWASKSGPKGYWADFSMFSRNRFCPFFKVSLINRKFMESKWDSIIDFVIESIDFGFYVYLNIDTYYIPVYENYLKQHSRHDIFIYGYDKEKKILNTADFFILQKYSHADVGFDDFEQSYVNYHLTGEADFVHGIELYTFEKEEYKFDIYNTAKSINEFLLSKNTMIASDWEVFDDKDDIVYGLQVYDVLHDYLLKVYKGETYLDIRPFHMLYDHKTIMLQRIKYLEKSNYLSSTEQLTNAYSELQTQCLSIRNKIIKALLLEDVSILEKSLNKLKMISEKEKWAMETMLNSLK